MKLHKVLLLISSALLLVACSNDSEPEVTEDIESDIEDVVDETTETKEVVEEPIEETLEIDENQPLENIGEYKYTSQGRGKLLNIIRPSETYRLTDGVNITFRDVKILHHSEIPDNQKEFFRNFYGFDDEGISVQFVYSVSNETDQKYGGIEILDVVTSNGNQYNLYTHGGSIDGSAYEVRPNATANVGVIFSIQETDIEGLDLYFQPLDKDGYHLEETSIHLDF